MGEFVTSKLVVNRQDMLKIEIMNAKVLEKAGKFMFKDINRDNLNYLAWEINHTAKQCIGDHLFLNLTDLRQYRLKYVAIHVNNNDGNIDFKPYFVRRELSASI